MERLVRTIRVGEESRHLPRWPNLEWMLGIVGEPSRRKANEGWGKKRGVGGKEQPEQMLLPANKNESVNRVR